MKQTFNWKTFLKEIAVIAIPVALQNLLTTTATMVDTIMIAPLGELNVGAVGLCAQFSNLMLAGYWGFVGGSILFYSQYWGDKDYKGLERSYGLTIVCMMTVALIFGSLAVFAPQIIMNLYTDKVSVQTIGIEYLKIIGFAYPLQIFSIALSTILRSTQKVKIPLIASICSVATNIFLNWCFIYGNLGFEAMGVRGAALASLCASFVNVVVILIAALKTNFNYIFHFKNHFVWDRYHTKEYFQRCFPVICNEVLVGVGNMIINVVLGHQTEEAIAAVAVFRTLEGMLISFFAGFASASSVIVGTNIGSGHIDYAQKCAKRIIYLCGFCILCVSGTLLLLNKPILTTMGLSGVSYTYGKGLLCIFAVVSVIRLQNWAQNDTFRAAGDSKYGTILEIVFMYCMVIPGVLLAAYKFKFPFLIIFCFCYSDEIVRYFLMQKHMYSLKWIKPVTQTGKDALDFGNLVHFWDVTFKSAKKEQVTDWHDLVPSEKLLNAVQSLADRQCVLDYGCGEGWASIALAKAGCKNIKAVDVTENAIDLTDKYSALFGVKNNINSFLIEEDWIQNQASEAYDGFVCSNVLDVIPQVMAQNIIRNAARILKKDAVAVIGLNYHMTQKKLVDGNKLYVDDVLRMVSLSDDQWLSLFEKYFTVEKVDHFAWPGEEKETRRLFILRK